MAWARSAADVAWMVAAVLCTAFLLCSWHTVKANGADDLASWPTTVAQNASVLRVAQDGTLIVKSTRSAPDGVIINNVRFTYPSVQALQQTTGDVLDFHEVVAVLHNATAAHSATLAQLQAQLHNQTAATLGPSTSLGSNATAAIEALQDSVDELRSTVDRMDQRISNTTQALCGVRTTPAPSEPAQDAVGLVVVHEARQLIVSLAIDKVFVFDKNTQATHTIDIFPFGVGGLPPQTLPPVETFWAGAIIDPLDDAVVIALPRQAPYVANFINLSTRTTTTTVFQHTVGGVLGLEGAMNGDIFTVPLEPSFANFITISATDRTSGNTFDGVYIQTHASSNFFGGLVTGADGRLYAIPYNHDAVFVVEPTARPPPLDATSFPVPRTAAKWSGGVLAPNGCIYALPVQHTHVLVINTLAHTLDYSSIPAAAMASRPPFSASSLVIRHVVALAMPSLFGTATALFAPGWEDDTAEVVDTSQGTSALVRIHSSVPGLEQIISESSGWCALAAEGEYVFAFPSSAAAAASAQSRGFSFLVLDPLPALKLAGSHACIQP